MKKSEMPLGNIVDDTNDNNNVQRHFLLTSSHNTHREKKSSEIPHFLTTLAERVIKKNRGASANVHFDEHKREKKSPSPDTIIDDTDK